MQHSRGGTVATVQGVDRCNSPGGGPLQQSRGWAVANSPEGAMVQGVDRCNSPGGGPLQQSRWWTVATAEGVDRCRQSRRCNSQGWTVATVQGVDRCRQSRRCNGSYLGSFRGQKSLRKFSREEIFAGDRQHAFHIGSKSRRIRTYSSASIRSTALQGQFMENLKMSMHAEFCGSQCIGSHKWHSVFNIKCKIVFKAVVGGSTRHGSSAERILKIFYETPSLLCYLLVGLSLSLKIIATKRFRAL